MIFDFHNDIITHKCSLKNKLDYLHGQMSSGVSVVAALWTSKFALSMESIESLLAPFLQLGRQHKNNLIFSIEDLNIVDASFDDIVNLPFLFYGLTHNRNNIYAGSCMEGNLGLLDNGKSLCKLLLENHKIVDTAHASKQCFYDIIECMQGKNIVCSHTCFEEVHSHARNLDKNQCDLIVKCGGMVGLTLVKDFLGYDDLQSIFVHIDWFVQRYGIDNLCIGTDFFGTTHLRCMQDYQSFKSLRLYLYNNGFDLQSIDKIFFTNLNDYIASHL
ncbi:MAG: membrane dipeptidase [Clostridiales bacterium]|jgi:membrane dipeptidase|nr:membrane dipeptidase [Clostridiales bacterium]